MGILKPREQVSYSAPACSSMWSSITHLHPISIFLTTHTLEPTYVPLRGRLLMPQPGLMLDSTSEPTKGSFKSEPNIISGYIRESRSTYGYEAESPASRILMNDTARARAIQWDITHFELRGALDSTTNLTERAFYHEENHESNSFSTEESLFECEYSGCPWCEHPTCVQIKVDCKNCHYRYLTAKHLDSCGTRKFSCLTSRLRVTTSTGRFCTVCTPGLMDLDRCQRCNCLL